MLSTACLIRGFGRHEPDWHLQRSGGELTTREMAVEAGEVRAPPRPAVAEIRDAMIPGRKTRSPLGDALRTLIRKPWAMVGLAVVVTWLLVGLLAPVLPIQDPDYQDLSQKLRSPGSDHPLGTDDLGRDMVSRIIWGARVSVPAGIL